MVMEPVTSYSRPYVQACRARVTAQVDAYLELTAAARRRVLDDSRLRAASAVFAPMFFNSLVIVLDAAFAHRARDIAGADGNPLNEVRVVAGSLLTNLGRMATDPDISFDSEASVLKLEPGQEIALDQISFVRLAGKFFDELDRRYCS